MRKHDGDVDVGAKYGEHGCGDVGAKYGEHCASDPERDWLLSVFINAHEFARHSFAATGSLQLPGMQASIQLTERMPKK